MLITDPAFYAVAIPAVILMGISKSGFASGLGALAVPLMAMVVPVPQAAAILLPVLFVVDCVGIQQLWRHRDGHLLSFLLPAGLVGTLVGAVLFRELSPPVVAGVVGALTLLFLLQRFVFPPKAETPTPSKPAGFVLGVTSGFTSFVAHAGGPPLAAYVLPLRLPPMAFAGTMAVFFGIINLSKWVPYAMLGLIDGRNLMTSLALIPLAPLGVWIGVWLARHVSPTWFYRLVYAGMFLTGSKLLYDAVAR